MEGWVLLVSTQLRMYLGPYVEHDYTDASVDFFDAYEEMHEALHTGEPHDGKLVWVRNKRRVGEAELGSLDDAGEMDLSRVRQWAEIEWFRRAFAEDLKVLEKHYGTLTFKWGLVRWWS